MNRSRTATPIGWTQALDMGPPPVGNLAIPVFGTPTIDVELYAPRTRDVRQPHERDEIYFVARGRARFVSGEERTPVATGSLVFVPAGQDHRFHEFSEDFAVWVLFYGPQGGEDT